MAGAMRKMGIYLGLVEEDDARAYGRYDARQADPAGHYDGDRYDADRYESDRFDSRPGRYEGRYDDRYASDAHGSFDSYGGEYDRYDDRRLDERRLDDRRLDDRRLDDRRYDDDRDAGRPGERGRGVELAPAPDPEPVALRRAGATRLGLAQPPAAPVAPVSAGPARLGPVGSAAAAGLAAREPVAVAPEPAPAPVREPYRITTLHPKTYNEARAIGEAFRDGSPVIMNLTELDHADARRLVDFAAGLIFGLRGSIEPVTAKVFLLSPQDVDVTAEDKAKIREGGFFDQS
ncbi:cell division inhibitor SepF [Geodermatophilus dictyosporus]|uniref:Cell division protein SepF n=1 Tax=Geodermatophilus dictyosporus TaxID=1523247 RepID=A0A1I5PQB9_9ACTN|nr:cell division protein SepF [Geodermatophilus dictyosporus]SFP36214.1 cell division inhibitor SepF [Geodermatophilus dictyosporus]